MYPGGEEYEEEEEDYQYHNWGVDRVDLDFKSVSDLQSLLAERRRGGLSYQLYKLSDKIDASLRQDLESVTVKSRLTTADTTDILHIITSSILSQDASQQPEILSSTRPQSIQPSTDLDIVLTSQSSNLSSTVASLLPSKPQQDTASILIPFAFFLVLILVSVFVLVQCSHFIVYMARQAFKDRNSGPKLRDFIRSDLSREAEVSQDVSLTQRGSGVRGLVVEVAAQSHHTSLSPQSPLSPVSILHNSPFYSPVATPASPASPHTNQPFMELERIIGNVCSDDQAELESPSGDYARDINDSDEGIESEDGEDIDGEAFKQLIRENVPEQNVFTKPPLVYSNCLIREEIYGGKIGAVTDSSGQYEARGNSLESPSVSLCSDQNSSSLSPPSPLQTRHAGWAAEHNFSPVSGVGECLI